MMGLMSLSQCQEIGTFRISQDLKSAMDENIVDGEICYAIQENSESNEKVVAQAAIYTNEEKNDAGESKNEKEQIVAFEPRIFISFVMMIYVYDPQESVHNEFVSKPSHEFHADKGAQRNEKTNHRCCFLVHRSPKHGLRFLKTKR